MTGLVDIKLQKAEAAPGASDSVRELGYVTGPSNQDILNAAKAAYTTYSSAVDAITMALINTVKDPTLADALARIDGTNWSSPGISVAVATPFFDSVEVRTALGVVTKTSDLKSFSAGVFTKEATVGGPGMIGFAEDVMGTGASGLRLELDIFRQIVAVDNTQNLQYGVWVGPRTELHDLVVGFYTNTTIQGIGTNMKILLTKTLQPYGFVASTGVSLPVSTGVFAGSTSQWTP
jgi:hypothetical protein